MATAQRTKNLAYALPVCVAAASGYLLLGYDTAVITAAEQALLDFFGIGLHDAYTDVIHKLVMSSAFIGCFFGSLLAGRWAQVHGRRNSMILASVLLVVSAAGCYMPEFMFRPGLKLFTPEEATMGMVWALASYRVVGGIGIGIISVTAPIYIAELSPADNRGSLVSCAHMAIAAGQLIVCIINYMLWAGIADTPDLVHAAMIGTGWRKMFLSEIYPAAAFALLLLFLPQTPFNLMMSGDSKKAYGILTRINGPEEAGEIAKDIRRSLSRRHDGISSYKGMMIFIGIGLVILQQALGINVLFYYAPQIFQSIGAGESTSLICVIIINAVSVLFAGAAITVCDRVGRRKLLITGSAGMALSMAALGALTCYGFIGVTSMLFMFLFTAAYMISWGPVCIVLISEIFPHAIRAKAVSVTTALQWASCFAVLLVFPKMQAWSLSGTCLIFSAVAILSGIFAGFFVPETKNKALEEIGALWTKGM